MTTAFPFVLAVQFLTALADNALVFAAIALLKSQGAAAWQIPVLQQSFVVAFIVLAPFVGHLADAWPKGRVMVFSNAVKSLGCLFIFADIPLLVGYACVGVGAAIYSPAKYGILSEIFPAERLVWANGWMEGITVAATILGAVGGGALASQPNAEFILAALHDWNFGVGLLPAPVLAIATTACCYAAAAVASHFLPATPNGRRLPRASAGSQAREFWNSLITLWNDAAGRLSIIVTSLLWGVGTALRFVILAWSATILQFSLERGAQLTALVVIGIAIGATWAGHRVPLSRAVRVLNVGLALGAAVTAMALVTDWRAALPLLILIGALGGYLLVPMNALLQHRGHLLVGAGHSIALQNAGENISILLMLGAYALIARLDVPETATVTLLGLCIVALSAHFSWRHRRA
jgi:MFS family permease